MSARYLASAAALSFAALATPAQADWWEASTDNFVIYADDSEKDVRRFAEDLERYHAAMEVVTGRNLEKPSPSNRVVIFVVGGQRDIRRLAGTDDRMVAGFYVPRAGASRAFVQDIRNKSGDPDFSMLVLLHEYAHHFLISTSRYALPRWLSEGSAEFFASASFERDGGVSVGRPARHRGAELFHAADVSVEELLDHELYEKRKRSGYDAFYGRSWLLYHYLLLSGERDGQLSQYFRSIALGKPSIEAGREAFGDLDELQDDLDSYLRQRRMSYLPLKADRIDIGSISMRALPEGEAEMMEVRIRSQRGVNEEQAAELVLEAREIAAEYPNDPGVLTALAEAEFDSGNDDAAIAAADRAIAIDPQRANAYVQKGYALFRKAGDADEAEAAYAAAMEPFSALNRIEQDHPAPLIHYYRSFVERGVEPNETARHALERASQLAPFDQALAMNAALMQAREGKIELARSNLGPIAANPHGGRLADDASRFREQLSDVEEGTEWSPRRTLDLGTILQAVADAKEADEKGDME